jgi:glycosyltransferase involved in cell wall biosynthesis
MPPLPLVSVVIPSYNHARFVTQAVDSGLAQTYPNVEVIVVDDGSKDGTRQSLKPYLGRIRYIYQENQGLAAARNTGIQAAQGAYVALLDADDLWHPQKLQRQLAYLAAHPNVALLAAAETTTLPNSWPVIPDTSPFGACPVPVEQLAMCSRFGPSGVVVARECFGRVGFFDTTLRSVEDRDMWLRIANHYPVHMLTEVLWYYRLHGNNMSGVARVMEDYELKVIRRWLSSAEGSRAEKLFAQRILARASYAAAVRYANAGQTWMALKRMAQSFTRWPLPLYRSDMVGPAERLQFLAVVLLRLMRIKGKPGCQGPQVQA